MLKIMIRKMRKVMFKGSLRGQHPRVNLVEKKHESIFIKI